MNNRETILEELKQISPLLAGIDRVNPYSVPYLYFEQLEGKVKKAISAQDDLPSIFNDLKAGKPMTVPAGYFDSLASNILQKIKEEETANVEIPGITGSEKLTGQHIKPSLVQDTDPFQPETIREPAKVIKMAPRKKIYLQWAVAAVTIGIIALVAFLYQGNEQTQNNLATTNTDINGISMETLEYFVDGQTVDFIPVVASSSSELTADDMRSVMEDISEEALQQYLNSQNNNLETQVN